MARIQRGRQANNAKRNKRGRKLKGSFIVSSSTPSERTSNRRRRSRDKRVGTIWDPINLSPEEIARACMQGPPKKEWDFLKKETPPEDNEGSPVL